MAVALTAIGVAVDAGSGTNNLGGVFATCYVLGCLAAVLAVRQSGIFTAVIQPPLILFVAVPFAYFVFHGSTFTGIKDTLINCGYPLIERFPLMFFTTATVLVVGLIRWYLGMSAKRVLPSDAEQTADAPDEVAAAASKLGTKDRRSTRSSEARAARAAAANRVDPVEDEAPRPSRRTPRTPAAGAERSTGAAAGKGSRRSRHSRPPETEIIEPVLDRPRRRNTPPVDPPAEPRRRPRTTEPRSREPREPREPREARDRRPVPPLDRRSGSPDRDRPDRERYDRPQRRDRADSYERPERPERRRPRSTEYEPYEPYEPPVTRTNGSNGTHHPISRVRYRGSEDEDSRTEHRTKPRRPRHSAPDSWE